VGCGPSHGWPSPDLDLRFERSANRASLRDFAEACSLFSAQWAVELDYDVDPVQFAFFRLTGRAIGGVDA
jgi:hypothetical protein